MAIKKRTWIMVLLALALLEVSTGRSSRAVAATNEYVESHNRARAEVGVEPLQWNQTLANLADVMVQYQRDAMGCAFAEPDDANDYGVNQMWAKGQAAGARAAVEEWVKEKPFYDYPSNTCKRGHKCKVYTQVVWRRSRMVGCAQAMCPREGITLTICYYKPQGNLVNTKPY